MTQKQLARRLGVTELSVIKYESGTSIPSREIMRRIYANTGGSVAPNDFYDLDTIQTSRPGISTMTNAVQPLLVVGLMSGTSMDGIDAALLATDGQNFIKECGHETLSYDSSFKALLKGAEYAVLTTGGNYSAATQDFTKHLRAYVQNARGLSGPAVDIEIKNLAVYLYGVERPILFDDVIDRSTHLHAQVVSNLLRTTGHRARDIDLIGYHGQTLFHRPADRITLQAGNGQLLANLTGIPVVFDFRAADVAAGGQGAPFAPLYHAALARQMGVAPVVVANCGGIANITVIPESDEIYAFDTGPGNALVDRFVFARTGNNCDLDGTFGLQGTVDKNVLQALKDRSVHSRDGSNYLSKIPPKSLDVNDSILIPELEALSLQDGCATLEHFTADCIVRSLDFLSGTGIKIPHLWIVAGGGWKNPVIFNTLEQLLKEKFDDSIRVQHATSIGWNGAALEAQLFAYLATRSIKGLPLSLPGTTGVPKPMSGGQVVVPGGDPRRASGRVRDILGSRQSEGPRG